MRNLNCVFLRKNLNNSLLAVITIALLFSCKKDEVVVVKQPVISYQQKIISLAEDMAMTPLRPDSTGGVITEYSVSPSLPKGIVINKLNGVISGTPSDTLLPVKFVVTATGPGGIDTDTLIMSVGTVAFNYGATPTFTFEINSTAISTTPLSPVILAGTFNQFFVSPSPDSLTFKTGLKFNAATGQISGTPNKLTSTTEVPTPVTFTITGISTSNKATSAPISFIINDKKPAFTYTFAGSFTVGTSIGNTLLPTVLSTSGIIKKYRLAPTSPALPDGLTLDSLTGRIQGTPTTASNVTIIVRGINTGGFQDVNVPLLINSTAVAPQVMYMMSLINGSVLDTISPRITSGNAVYLTKSDGIGQVLINLNPVVTAGQVLSYAVAPAFSTNTGNGNLSLNTATGIVSGTPGALATAGTTSTHTLTINNAATGGPAGSFAMNVVANAPFFTYNSTGKGATLPNIFYFVQNQSVDVANGTYPGYTSAELAPVNGAGVTSYTIYPATATTQPFSATGLTFNTTTGAISGTPTSNTQNLTIYSFWDYVVVGKKADGSFTVYKIRFKIYPSISVWSN
jgi:hypothetical protein